MFYTTQTTTYIIEPVTTKRVTDFVDGQPVWTETTLYNVLHDGEFVTYAPTEEELPVVIDIFEGGGDRIDPIYFTGLTAGWLQTVNKGLQLVRNRLL